MKFRKDFILAFLYILGLFICGVCVLVPLFFAITVSPWIGLSILVTLPFGIAAMDALLDLPWWR